MCLVFENNKSLIETNNQVFIILLLLFSFVFQASAQTPSVVNGLLSTDFPGEQLCFDATLNNTGASGYGPYLRLVLPPEMSFDSAQFLGTGVTITSVGTFPASPGNLLTDPKNGDVLTGPDGGSLLLLQYPLGSVIAGGPDLTINICATISVSTGVGESLDVTLQPVYEYGDTATGINGRIEGTAVTASVLTTLYLITKDNNAPEAENPPSNSSQYINNYSLTIDVANTKTVFDPAITDTLDSNTQYDGNLVITGGTNCMATTTPSLITAGGNLVITCDSITGTTSATDVVISYDTYIIDALDESNCGTLTTTNNLSVDLEFPDDIPQTMVFDSSDIVAKHLALRSSTAPFTVVPGDTVTFTLNFALTAFDSLTGLEIVDTLADGYTFASHQSASFGVIIPSVSINAAGVSTVTYDVTGTTGSLPAGTTGTITYTATLDQTYTDTGLAVLASDTLLSQSTATYSLDAGATDCTDSSSSTVNISPLTITKEIVNLKTFYIPGDTLTFRLSMNLPSGDASNVLFEDFLPLPVFDVLNLDLTYGNDIRRDFVNDTLNLTPDSITINAATNSLTIDWPDIDTTSTQRLAVLVDVTIVDEPFNDNLFLTNLFLASSENTPGAQSVGTTPVALNVGAADLQLTKGISASDNPTSDATITPSPMVLPVAGDITSADAGDTITFVMTLENTGTAPAFDVLVTDPAVTELTNPALVSVVNDKGRAIGTTGSLNTGLVLDEAIPVANTHFLEAHLSVTLFADGGTPGQVDPGDTLEYTINILNNDGAVTNALFNTIVPTDTTYVGASLSSTVGSANDSGSPGLSVDLGSMNEADTATISYRVTVDAVGNGTVIDSQGTVNSDQTIVELTDSTGNDTDGDQIHSITVGTALGAQINAPVLTSEKVLVTVSYTLSGSVEPEQVITNTASLSWASASGATSFSAITDAAIVMIGSPLVSKTLTAISPGYAGNLTEVHIGEMIDYTIVVTVPEGTLNNVTLTDLLDNGLAFTEMISITASSGDLTTNIGTFSDVGTAATITNLGAGSHQLDRSLSLDFDTLTNTNTDDLTAETLTIVTRARVLNWTGNTRGSTLNNNVAFNWDNPNAGGQLNVTDSANDVTIIEPELIITQSFSTTTGDAGDQILVTINIAHSGASDADSYDVNLEDVLPTGLLFVGFDADSGSVNPTTGPSYAAGTRTITASWNSFPQGGTGKVVFFATVDSSVSPESIVTNTATLEWESLLSADQGTLTATPSNTLDAERTGNTTDIGTTANTYSTSGSDSFTIPTASITKTIDSVSPNGAGPNATTGDLIDYRMTVTLPEGTPSNLVLTDVLPAGFEFQTAVLDTTGFVGTATIASSAVTSGSVMLGQTATIAFLASTTVNGDNNGANNSFAVILTASVNDHVANNGSIFAQTKTNRATLSYTGSAGTIQGTVDIGFAEPELSITKTMSPDTGLSAGDTVTITLFIENNGTAPAYDIIITDILNDGGELLFDTSSAIEGTTPMGYTYSFADPTVSWIADPANSLAGGGTSSTFEFTAVVRSDVVTGSTFDNTASVSGDSQDGLVTGERATSDSSTDSVTTTTVSTGKSLIASSESWTSDTAPIEAAIGEILSFQLVFEIPEGVNSEDTSAAAVITDTLPVGHSFMVGSATISTDADIGVTGSFFGVIPLVDTAISPVVNGQDLEFDLGDITNSDNDGNVERLIINYDVLVLNSADNNRTNSKTNTTSFNYQNTDGMGQSITDTSTWSIAESNISITKTASPATVEGGDTVTFTVTLTNNAATNATRAWEPIITDTLPGRFQAPFTVISVIHSSYGFLGTSASFIGNVLTADLSGDLVASDNYMAPGDTITLIYTAVVDPAVNYEEDITNTATATVSSLPGNNGTGSLVPGSPGATDGERTGSGAGENDLSDSDTATVTAGKPTITKSSDTNLQILETAMMTLQVDIPVGTTSTFVITDDLPSGLNYTGASITINTPATNFTASNSPSATPGAGTDPLVFDFGTITNSSGSAQSITINYQVSVENILANQNTTSLVNTATVTYTGASMPFGSGSATITVIEPNLETAKNITVGAAGSDAGDVIEYTISVSNTAGIATAYRVDLEDILPAHLLGGAPTFNITSLDDDGGQIIDNGGGALTSGDAIISTTTNTDDTLSWPLLDIPAGATLTIVYEAVLSGDVVAGEMLSNTITANYNSLQAGGGRDDTDSWDDEDGNLDNYGETDTATLTVDSSIAIQKSLNASHADNDFTIGDLVTFDIRVDVIEGIKGNVVVTDILPTGLLFEGPARIVAGANISYSGAGIVVQSPLNTLTIDFGNVTNNFDNNSTNDFFITEIDARVLEQISNNDGMNLINSVSLTADVGPAGPDTQVIDIVEPNLTVSKSVNNTLPELGEEITYTITVSHTSSTADAFDVILTDIIPVGLSYVAGSHSGDGMVNETDLSSPIFDLGTITQVEINKSFTFNCIVENTAMVGVAINNEITMNYDSQSGAPTIQRTYTTNDNINVTANAYVGVAQDLTINGTQVTFDFYLENFDAINLNSLSLPFDLDLVFGAGNYTVLLGPTIIDDPGTLVLNGGYNGSGDIQLISSGTFNPLETAQIQIVVVVDNVINQVAGIGNYVSQIVFSAQTSNGIILSDLSDDGQDPDPNGTTNPTEIDENDPNIFFIDSSTPVELLNYSIE